MTSQFSHPSSDKLLGTVLEVFQNRKIYQRKDRHIIFICGGSVKTYSRSIRRVFLKYAKSQLTQFRVFLAEAATQDLILHNEPEFINVADFETLIAEISDCIIIFPESAGSIAELGFFANSEKAIKKLLVVNDILEQDDSFINVGIIDRINSYSDFRQIIITDYKNPDFSHVESRLINRLPVRHAKKFQFDIFEKLDLLQKFYILFELIFIFRALTFDSTIYCLEKIFGKVDKKEIKQLLSILIAVNYIKRFGEDLDYYVIERGVDQFLEFRNYDIQKLITYTTSFYKDYHTETYDIIKEVIS